MNRLIENGQLQEMICGTNFSYILGDNNAFLSTEYKVLQSQINSCFVKCMKMQFNGDVQLLYLTKSLKPFSAMLPTIDADGFLTVAANLIADIIDVKQNGFLSCQHIDISFDKIFVDPTNYKVSLVYVPIRENIFDDNLMFENEIRTGLVKLISGIPAISSPKTMQFAMDLSNGMLSLDDLLGRLKSSSGSSSTGAKVVFSTAKKTAALRMVALNAPMPMEMRIEKNGYLIGKNVGAVDGYIAFNKMVSRVHCRIDKNGSDYFITDLNSVNGTFINNAKLQPNRPYPINDGDIVRIANSDFRVMC